MFTAPGAGPDGCQNIATIDQDYALPLPRHWNRMVLE